MQEKGLVLTKGPIAACGIWADFGSPFFIMNENDTCFENQAREVLELAATLVLDYSDEVDFDDLHRRLMNALDEPPPTPQELKPVNWQKEGF